MKQQIRNSGRVLVQRLAPSVMTSVEDVPRLRGEVDDLRKVTERLRRRISELEDEVQENRRLNRRIAELTDIVEQLLLPDADRDEDRLRERLERYSDRL